MTAMTLNIKNDETRRLARELARLTNETKYGAITILLRERLERERWQRNPDKRLRYMPVIVERSAPLAVLYREPDAVRFEQAGA